MTAVDPRGLQAIADEVLSTSLGGSDYLAMKVAKHLANGLAWMRESRGVDELQLSLLVGLPQRCVQRLIQAGRPADFIRQGHLPMVDLHDLPAHRRKNFRLHAQYGLNRYIGYFRPEQQRGQRIVCLSLLPCDLRRDTKRMSRARPHAQEGLDGLYHLRTDAREHQCQAIATHNTPVKLRKDWQAIDPRDVPNKMRCNPEHPGWGNDANPPSHTSAKMTPIVEQLHDIQGLLCATCHKALAVVVDHDHETGMVRGLLCRSCNVQVDACPHPAGCPFAEYLNTPPAPPGLRYPRA